MYIFNPVATSTRHSKLCSKFYPGREKQAGGIACFLLVAVGVSDGLHFALKSGGWTEALLGLFGCQEVAIGLQ